MNQIIKSRLLTAITVAVLVATMATSSLAQRRGSFGGGGRSFGGFGGGGGFRSSPGGSFGGGARSNSSGSFGRSNSFGSSAGTARSGSSFGRTGSFGNSGRVNSTSVSGAPSVYRGVPYSSYGYYGGGRYYGYGGYGDYWFHPAWYYWMPFHPAFYYGAPYYYNGAYYPGGFSFTRLIIGLVVILFVIWLITRIFSGGGGRGVRYTSYR